MSKINPAGFPNLSQLIDEAQKALKTTPPRVKTPESGRIPKEPQTVPERTSTVRQQNTQGTGGQDGPTETGKKLKLYSPGKLNVKVPARLGQSIDIKI
jgi:hypothetical protein